MNFSELLLIPTSAAIAACWIIGRAILSKKEAGLQTPFLLSYGLGVLLMEPWTVQAWQEAGMFFVMLLMLALSVIVGCIIGAVPALIAIATTTRLRRLFRG